MLISELQAALEAHKIAHGERYLKTYAIAAMIMFLLGWGYLAVKHAIFLISQ